LGTLASTQARRDNLPLTVTVNNATASITTTSPGRRGITLGSMSTLEIDNPECLAAVPATVEVRRLKASTLPGGGVSIDYTAVGTSSVAALPGQSIWVELVPAVFSDPGTGAHYCLQAIGGAPPADPPPSWMAAFDLNDRHRAQKNIVFGP
jgi:hypothetical protein